MFLDKPIAYTFYVEKNMFEVTFTVCGAIIFAKLFANVTIM